MKLLVYERDEFWLGGTFCCIETPTASVPGRNNRKVLPVLSGGLDGGKK
jgi:hypothetical protein